MMDWREKWPERVASDGRLKRTVPLDQKLEVFIYRANTIHGGKYTYSRAVYRDAKANVWITCPTHGDFAQLPNNHLKGYGCPQCALASKTKTITEFVAEARKVHGKDWYDYGNSVYVNSGTNLLITCPIHGDFEQRPDCHLAGQGCPTCAAEGRRKTIEEFVEEANLIHNGKYSYSNAKYVGAFDKLLITCNIHGDFEQRPSNHLAGQGCPHCMTKSPSTHVYLLEYQKGTYKIGVTNNMSRRLYDLRRAYQGGPIEVIRCVPRATPLEDEKYLLAKYKQCPTLGIPGTFDGYTELRNLTESEVAEICSFLDQN